LNLELILSKERKQVLQRLARHSEFIASEVRKLSIPQVFNWPQRARGELARHSEVMASKVREHQFGERHSSPQRIQSEELQKRPSSRKQGLATASNILAWRAKAISEALMTWQKSTDEASSTRHSEL
jgi:hypothetical protein